MIRRSAFTALLLLAVACGGSEQPVNRSADSAAIRNLIARAAAANNQGDVEAWVALFEDTAVYMPPGSPEVTTRAGLREVATAGFGRFRTEIRIAPSEMILLGNWAVVRSQVTGVATPVSGGDGFPVDVKQLAVYHRQLDGTWRIARLINNSNRE